MRVGYGKIVISRLFMGMSLPLFQSCIQIIIQECHLPGLLQFAFKPTGVKCLHFTVFRAILV